MNSARRVTAVLVFATSAIFMAGLTPSAAYGYYVGQASYSPSEFALAFQRGGGSARIGNPINEVHGWGNGCIQDFRGGLSAEAAIMQANCRGPAYFVIYGQWRYIVSNWGGAATGVIGYPMNDAYRHGSGWYQDFLGGSWGRTVIARADSTRAEKSVRGNILSYWLSKGGAIGSFRYPLTDSYPWNGGHRQEFEGGSIFWSTSTGSITLPATPIIAPREQRAAGWAIAERNSPNPRWSDEFMRPWSGYCEGFVEVAFGTRGQFTSAIAHYYWQLGRGRINTGTNAPVGAVVFYGGGMGYGHIGVSIGSGQVISTQGYNGQYLPVWQHYITGISNPYLGWAYAPPGWAGR